MKKTIYYYPRGARWELAYKNDKGVWEGGRGLPVRTAAVCCAQHLALILGTHLIVEGVPPALATGLRPKNSKILEEITPSESFWTAGIP